MIEEANMLDPDVFVPEMVSHIKEELDMMEKSLVASLRGKGTAGGKIMAEMLQQQVLSMHQHIDSVFAGWIK